MQGVFIIVSPPFVAKDMVVLIQVENWATSTRFYRNTIAFS